jgi:hypothetical protein
MALTSGDYEAQAIDKAEFCWFCAPATKSIS